MRIIDRSLETDKLFRTPKVKYRIPYSEKSTPLIEFLVRFLQRIQLKEVIFPGYPVVHIFTLKVNYNLEIQPSPPAHVYSLLNRMIIFIR